MVEKREVYPRGSRRRRLSRWVIRASGYNLIALAVFITVLNIVVAAALPRLTQAMDREREEELIFRGLQYAEAIRVFQKRTGRFPVRLDELLEVEPRAIRQLWTDPFRDDGLWGVVIGETRRDADSEGRNQQRRGRRRNRPPSDRTDPSQESDKPVGIPTQDVGKDRNRGSQLSRQGAVSTGPIVGVRSIEKRSTVKTFAGSNSVTDWVFTADLIPALPAAAMDIVPRLNSQWIGRPFPEGLEPAQGNVPSDPAADKARQNRKGETNSNRRRARGGSDRN